MSDHVPWELRQHDKCHRAQDELRAKIAEQAEVIRKLREELAAAQISLDEKVVLVPT